MDEDYISKELLDQEKELDKKIQFLARIEEEEWRLRSRSLWLKGGDMNTKFFHNQCKDQQMKNTITKLYKDNGEKIT